MNLIDEYSFDEKAFAEKMHDKQGFINSYSLRELCIYARWLKYIKLQEIGKDYLSVSDDELKQIEKYVENSLIDFSEKHYSEFNYTQRYKDIDYAVSKTRDAKLLIPRDVPITKKEYEKLLEIEEDEYRRIMFIMLVVAKFIRFNNSSLVETEINENTMFFVGMKYRKIAKLAGVGQTKELKKNATHYLYEHGFIDRTKVKDLYYVKIVDITNTDVVEWIHDFEHLILHYERLFDVCKIGECQVCGQLFRQNKCGTKLYCNLHSKYRKKDVKTQICTDCGKEYDLPSNVTLNKRCPECQRKYRLIVKKRYADSQKLKT